MSCIFFLSNSCDPSHSPLFLSQLRCYLLVSPMYILLYFRFCAFLPLIHGAASFSYSSISMFITFLVFYGVPSCPHFILSLHLAYVEQSALALPPQPRASHLFFSVWLSVFSFPLPDNGEILFTLYGAFASLRPSLLLQSALISVEWLSRPVLRVSLISIV